MEMIENAYLGLTEFLPEWYVLIGMAYAFYFFVRSIWDDVELVIKLFSRVMWNTLALPLLLGFVWPFSLLMQLSQQIWDLQHIWIFRQLYGRPWEDEAEEEYEARRKGRFRN